MSESLEVKFTFPCGAEESVPVSFIQNGNGAASTPHTLVSSDFGDVEQYWGCGDVIGSDVVWRRFGRESVLNILGETGREMSRHVAGIVRVGARFAANHSDARLGGRAGHVRGEVKI